MEEKDINIEEEEQLTDEMADDATATATDTEAPAEGEQPAGEATDETPAEEQDPLAEAQAEIEELKKQALYKAAEFDNYRKRTLKERAELILNGGEKAITALLPVIDDMERAIGNGQKTDDPQVLREGMELIYHKMMKVLEGLGVQKIETDDAETPTCTRPWPWCPAWATTRKAR